MTTKLGSSADGSYSSLSVGANEVMRLGSDNSGRFTAFRNKIINGGMVIDQRNAGASLTQTASLAYSVDRFSVIGSVMSKFSIRKNLNSITPPAGFGYYVGVTSLSAYSIPSGESYRLQQGIEGLNCQDLAWGTASASPVTLSFYVRSSKTGTFGGCVYNNAGNRCYPFSYTINAIDTWERKTITIAGDTSGTWEIGTLAGLNVSWSLGAAGTVLGTAGAWGSTLYYGVTGQTNIVDTNAATWYVTGVQLEKGSIATPFEFKPINVEFEACFRYFESVYLYVSTTGYPHAFKVIKRDTPTYVGGGGSGFSNSGVLTESEYYASQTTGALQTLKFSAEYGSV